MIASLVYSSCFVLTVHLYKLLKSRFRNPQAQTKSLKFKILAVFIVTLVFTAHSVLSLPSESRESGYLDAYLIKFEVWPVLYAVAVNSLLFLGPWYQEFALEGKSIRKELSAQQWGSWEFLRLVLYAPLFEEIVYRDLIYVDLIRSNLGGNAFVLISSGLFSIAHAHNFFRIRKKTERKQAILTTAFQMSFTFVFGAYSSAILVKTQSIFASIALHSYCNVLGFPKVNEIFREKDQKVRRKVYAAYVIGLIAFFVVIIWF